MTNSNHFFLLVKISIIAFITGAISMPSFLELASPFWLLPFFSYWVIYSNGKNIFASASHMPLSCEMQSKSSYCIKSSWWPFTSRSVHETGICSLRKWIDRKMSQCFCWWDAFGTFIAPVHHRHPSLSQLREIMTWWILYVRKMHV